MSSVSHLIALRRWAVALLEAPDAAPPTPALADVPAWGWRHLGRHDRVALPLVRALERRGAAAPAPLAEQARIDLQTRLQLDAVLHGVLAAARSAGVELLLLKGTGAPIDAELSPGGDLDLLVPFEQFDALTDALRRDGWDLSALTQTLRACTFRITHPAHPVDLDLHTRLPELSPFDTEVLWRDAAELPPRLGARRLSDVAATWHLLVHGAVKHPDRWGVLRDAQRLRAAYLAASTDVRTAVASLIAAHPRRRLLARVWEAAGTSLAALAELPGSHEAAAVREWDVPGPIRWRRYDDIRQRLRFALLAGADVWRAVMSRAALAHYETASGRPSPPKDRAIAVSKAGLRVILYLAAHPPAIRGASRARRAIREALASA